MTQIQVKQRILNLPREDCNLQELKEKWRSWRVVRQVMQVAEDSYTSSDWQRPEYIQSTAIRLIQEAMY
jgi:hypothetical protein